jgi:beta-glucanase (GH16 family)
MPQLRFRLLALCASSVLALSACGSAEPLEPVASSSDALVVGGITLQTLLVPRFLSAQNGGGGALLANGAAARAWETFALDDLNGGALESGDSVTLRTSSGQYLQAVNGGGAALGAYGVAPQGWETFRLVKRSGGGVIVNGDVVGLQTQNGAWVSAENGGGGNVSASSRGQDTWESFRIGGLLGSLNEVAGVSFRTTVAGRYLSAQNNGGAGVVASAQGVQNWETFALEDLNGGLLQDGDRVLLRTGSGRYLQAPNGGGSSLNAASNGRSGWETFRIIRQGGPGTVAPGDAVGLLTESGAWVSAENGGGGNVNAAARALSTWETFVIGIGAPTSNDWRLVWRDEFDGGAIDGNNWAFEQQGPGWVNNERQAYTSRWENARQENGSLVIEARRDFVGGEYSSARLKTQGKASWTYGRFEARMQLPGGWGTWPAFWLMPEDFSRGWPACGEIDIMEEVGYEQDSIHSTTHSLAYNFRNPNQRTSATTVGGVTGGFHIYVAEWYPDRIDFFVDGHRFFTSPNDNTGDDAWPFNKPFYVILNLAVGGDWGGAQGIDPGIWPRRLLVDYVRVYQR